MVAYPERWMDRVDAMKSLQGWTDASVLHFRDLGEFGEQILLSIRFGDWSDVNDPLQAANWARFWRPEIQGYIHAYRAVTGVDLTADVSDTGRLRIAISSPRCTWSTASLASNNPGRSRFRLRRRMASRKDPRRPGECPGHCEEEVVSLRERTSPPASSPAFLWGARGLAKPQIPFRYGS